MNDWLASDLRPLAVDSAAQADTERCRDASAPGVDFINPFRPKITDKT
jgi:hypothetical protein